MPLESASTVPRLVWEDLIGTAGVSFFGGGGGSEDSCPFAGASAAASSIAATIIVPNLNILCSNNKMQTVKLGVH
jgi:hypothetical protein